MAKYVIIIFLLSVPLPHAARLPLTVRAHDLFVLIKEDDSWLLQITFIFCTKVAGSAFRNCCGCGENAMANKSLTNCQPKSKLWTH